uniref:ectoine/hydroxyectoine ABC transporter substrate-binding protein EhuB n=1 Tax=Aminobacter niigataensis TaxID=83265 RepID=UPI002852944A|nr:ectoine/hydroxyectoine ABC transporter substrate-binding protein EhuB [Aminobacter niigataensis]WMD00085.1 ectoine/hydroxyectoine ABC transporter substrate-binding protein EhuB [Aminobacter niigataensis]
MKLSFTTTIKSIAVAALAIYASVGISSADTLLERAKEGKSIRIGFTNEVPLAYPGTTGEPDGFVNVYVLNVLKKMGYTNIEPVQTDWGGLIPGLEADRFDIITAGMYVLKQRCENVLFAEPMAEVSDIMIVPKGNPKAIQNYTDVAASGAKMATCVGCNTIANAQADGVKEENIVPLPQMEDMLIAVTSGRADAAVGPYFTMLNFVQNSQGAVELTDPTKMPEVSRNWNGIVFRKGDADFVKAFDEAQASYLGSPEMLEAVAPYGYSKVHIPNRKLDWICQNR